MRRKITKWAIVGLGAQAEKIAQAINKSLSSKLQAVMSNNVKRAHSFALKWKAENYYTSLDILLRERKINFVLCLGLFCWCAFLRWGRPILRFRSGTFGTVWGLFGIRILAL